jgi:hypothetical protein
MALEIFASPYIVQWILLGNRNQKGVYLSIMGFDIVSKSVTHL